MSFIILNIGEYVLCPAESRWLSFFAAPSVSGFDCSKILILNVEYRGLDLRSIDGQIFYES
jgi:hypothetical protein